MLKYTNLVLAATVISILSCSSPKEVTGITINNEKVNSRSFKKIFIVAATLDIEVRNKLETELAAIANTKGYNTVKSLDVLPFSFETMKLPAKEEIEKKVRESNSDAILILSLSRSEGAISYSAGIEMKQKDPILGNILAEILKRDNVANPDQYKTPIKGVSVPGHFEKGKANFTITGNLCDGITEEVLATIQGQNIDLSDLEEQSRSYAAMLINLLEKQKLLKKK